MKYIDLTRGHRAIVDDEDYERLSKLKWSVCESCRKKGSTWYANYYYKSTTEKNKHGKAKVCSIGMHRMIMDAPKGSNVDHKNGNPLDNRRENLRFCTMAENIRNQRRTPTTLSPYKGVHAYRVYDKKYIDGKQKMGYTATVMYGGEVIALGWFGKAKIAARSYDQIAKVMFGEFACLNFPS